MTSTEDFKMLEMILKGLYSNDSNIKVNAVVKLKEILINLPYELFSNLSEIINDPILNQTVRLVSINILKYITFTKGFNNYLKNMNTELKEKLKNNILKAALAETDIFNQMKIAKIIQEIYALERSDENKIWKEIIDFYDKFILNPIVENKKSNILNFIFISQLVLIYEEFNIKEISVINCLYSILKINDIELIFFGGKFIYELYKFSSSKLEIKKIVKEIIKIMFEKLNEILSLDECYLIKGNLKK